MRPARTKADDPEWAQADDVFIALNAGLTVDFSVEAAEANGLEIARNLFPEEEGYHSHEAVPKEMPIAEVEKLLNMVTTGGFETEYEDVPELPEKSAM